MESNSISLLELLQRGGWAMFPLSLVSLVLFALIIYAWLLTKRKSWIQEDFMELLIPESDNATSFREAQEQIWEKIESTSALPRQLIQHVNVIASVSPMIGLLGTVSGMIGAFQTIARGGMGKPELLAGNIGEALITTATGLVIAIPALIAFTLLRNRLESSQRACAEKAENQLSTMATHNQDNTKH